MTRDPLRCGNCGGEEFKLYFEGAAGEVRFGGGGVGHKGQIMTRCLKCNDESKIKLVPAMFDTHGSLCGGWRGRG